MNATLKYSIPTIVGTQHAREEANGDAIPISRPRDPLVGSQGIPHSFSPDEIRVLHERLLERINGWHAHSSRTALWILAALCQWRLASGDSVERHVILSKGHASPALYTVLASIGLVGEEELLTSFSQPGSRLQSHPVRGTLTPIPVSTGSLGQGLSIANGLALASRIDGRRREIAVVVGDGELDEGMVWEALATASTHGLDNIILVIDRNMSQLSGPTEEVKRKEPLRERLEAFGWHVEEAVNTLESIAGALERLREAPRGKPRAVIVRSPHVSSS